MNVQSSNIEQLMKMERKMALFQLDPYTAIQLWEFAPDGIIVTDYAGGIEYVNRAAELLFSYSRMELSGKPVEILLPKEYSAKHEEHRRSFMNNPRIRPMGQDMDITGVTKSGTVIPLMISLTPLVTPDGVQVAAFVRRK